MWHYKQVVQIIDTCLTKSVPNIVSYIFIVIVKVFNNSITTGLLGKLWMISVIC